MPRLTVRDVLSREAKVIFETVESQGLKFEKSRDPTIGAVIVVIAGGNCYFIDREGYVLHTSVRKE